ncbi:MAG: hypothetical protein V5A55_09405 [Halovenus sp.]
MSDTDSKFAAFLREHPKLLGALFGLTVLLTQISPALAGNGSAVSGP